MTAEQLEVAVQFTDELTKLEVLCLPPFPAEIKANHTPILFAQAGASGRMTLVPATPANLGQTFLRRSYNLLYAEVQSSNYVMAELFYFREILDKATIQDVVCWWK
jgi:hypothetical protein